jgi:hypothetical protein
MVRVSGVEDAETTLRVERQLLAPLATEAEARVDDDVVAEPA